jgi:uncharacterized protein (DUF1330 family)
VSTELTLVVLLFVANADEFERFEACAADIMSRYGGKIERRISFPPGDDRSQPDELHVVTFPDSECFERYRRDPDLRALATLRAKAIRETVVWQAVGARPFSR